MKLSIITINRNNLTGLQKTVESVIAQTWQEFEYIVIDGASTDGSAEYIANNAAHFTYWLSEPDNGVYNAMNKGILHATGEYLLFMNAGDTIADNDVLYKVFNSGLNTDYIIGIANEVLNGKKKSEYRMPHTITLKTLLTRSIPHQATFIKKELFDKYGLYREDFKIMSDWEQFLRATMLYNASVGFVEFSICDFDCSGMSSTGYYTDLMKKEQLQALQETPFVHVLPDYNEWKRYLSDNADMLWAWRKPSFRKLMQLLYKIALKYNNKE